MIDSRDLFARSSTHWGLIVCLAASLAAGACASTDDATDSGVLDDSGVLLDSSLRHDGGAQDSGPEGIGVPDGAPSGLRADVVRTTSADLQWTDNSTNEEAFVIERWDSEMSAWLEHTTAAADSTMLMVTNLAPNSEHGMRVRARNRVGTSDVSNEIWFETPADDEVCGNDVCGGGETCASCAPDCGECSGELVFQDDFDGYDDDPGNHGWNTGSDVRVISEGCRSGRCVEVTYNSERQGTSPHIFRHNAGLAEGTLSFSFRRVGSGGGGPKWVKFFGVSTGDNRVANFTLGNDYASGNARGVSCGPGTHQRNDTQCRFGFNGTVTGRDCTGTIRASAGEWTTREDSEWHSYRVYFRQNTDGRNDGEIRIWLDDRELIHVTEWKMRHDLNIREFRNFGLGGHIQSQPDGEFRLLFDDIHLIR